MANESACFELKDLAEATRQWNAVLCLSATDAFAKQGLAAIATLQAAPTPSNEPAPKNDPAKKSQKKLNASPRRPERKEKKIGN